MRGENARLRERMQEMNRKFELLLISDHKQAPQPSVMQLPAPPQEEDPEPIVEDQPEHSHPTACNTTNDEKQDGTLSVELEPGVKRRAPLTKRRTSRSVEERITWLEEAHKQHVESTNKRLSALEATVADLVVRVSNIEKILSQIQETLQKL